MVPTHRVLCAMARAEILADPFADDFEWTERVKLRLVRQRFDYPAPHELLAALRAVERALTKVWGPRPLPLPPARPVQTSAAPLTHEESVAILAEIGKGLIKTMPRMRPVTRRDVERQRVARLFARAVVDQVARCEAAEAAAADATSTAPETEPTTCR